MKIATLALLLPLPLVAALHPAPSLKRQPVSFVASPAFAVEEGTEIVKVFEQSFDVELDSISMVFDGNEMPTDGFDLSMTREMTSRIELSDSYVSVGDGQPNKLKRSFVSLSGESISDTVSPQGEEHKEDTETSELEGATVVFTWDADEEEYTITFDEDEGDEDLLEDLEEDTDLRAFLPEDDVEEGDSWKIEGKAFDALFSPGGDLKLEGEEEEEEDGLNSQFEENLDGDMLGTYKGLREVDGVEVAVIELSGELWSEAEEDVEQGMGEGSMTAALTMEITGELLWDLEGGHFASVEVEGAVEMSMDTEMTIQEEHEMEQSMAFTGTITFTASAERE
jgi:hypothetical protein